MYVNTCVDNQECAMYIAMYVRMYVVEKENNGLCEMSNSADRVGTYVRICVCI